MRAKSDVFLLSGNGMGRELLSNAVPSHGAAMGTNR